MKWKKGMSQRIKITRKNWFELAAMTVVFVIAAILVYRTTILVRMPMPNIVSAIKADKECYYTVESGDIFEQTFFYTSADMLLSVGTQARVNEAAAMVFTDKGEMDLGKLFMEVIDVSNGTVIMSQYYDVGGLKDKHNLMVSFPDGAKEGYRGKELKLVLRAEDVQPEVDLKLGIKESIVKGTSFSFNGEMQGATLNIRTSDHQFFYWRRWSICGGALIYLLLAGTYFGLAVFRMKPEKVFLFSGSILAVLYLLLLPPLTVPDEETHFKEAYYYANEVMGVGNTDSDVVTMDIEDYHAMRVFQIKPSLSEFDEIKEKIFVSGREEGTKDIERFDTQAPMVTYLPGMAGIILGRVLGVNGLMVMYMGRVFSILFYLFIMYWFIRIMPFGKAAAFIMAILPMTIQQCGSYSYDSVVIEIAFLYLAVLFSLLYEKEKPIQKWQVIVYVICIVMLSICKGGTYLPLCLLTLLIPIGRFQNKKQKWVFVGSMAAISIVAFLTSTLSYVLYVAAPTAEQAAGTYLKGESYGLAGILQTPMTFVELTLRSLFLSGDGFLETMLGMQLGWLNIMVTRIAIYGFLLLMVLSVLKTENKKEQIMVTGVQKATYLLVILLSAGMVFASMFMSWTSVGSTYIAGIQGRYFLPLLPILLLLFWNKNVTVKKDMTGKLIFIGVCLQCAVIYNILLSLERIL